MAEYAALDCPAWVDGKEVLLAVRTDAEPTRRKVIALFPNEARLMHDMGRLSGWTPVNPAGEEK